MTSTTRNNISNMATLDVPSVSYELRISGTQLTEVPPGLNTNLSVAEVDLSRNQLSLASICELLDGVSGATDVGPLPDETLRLMSLCDAPDADVDMDGLSAYEELLAGCDPENADTDGDGYPDAEEVVAGTYPHIADSYPTDNASTLEPSEMAAILLGQFEALNTGGTGYRLEFAECREAIAGLTYGQFEALDANQSGGLSELELEKVLAVPPGCNLDATGRRMVADSAADVVLAGLVLFMLSLGWRGTAS